MNSEKNTGWKRKEGVGERTRGGMGVQEAKDCR